MARHDNADRIAARCRARSARTARMPRAARELAIADGFAKSHSRDGLPYCALERRALGRERDIEAPAPASEVLRQLALRLAQQLVLRVLFPVGLFFRMMLLPIEKNSRESPLVGEKQHAALRALKSIVVAHVHSFASDCQRCMTA